MQIIATVRQAIYDHFHGSARCAAYFFDHAHADEYAAYYNSMYLLQDSTESLLWHRTTGFATPPLAAYLEFWGVMQAAIIQQDAIAELNRVILGHPLNARAKGLSSWLQLRELRNVCAGHPARKSIPSSQPLTRSFMGRSFGNYSSITYEQWQQGVGITHPRVSLGLLLDAYEQEAGAELASILAGMKVRWP
jgi:hypothetical protein